jgi:hypothetical protein
VAIYENGAVSAAAATAAAYCTIHTAASRTARLLEIGISEDTAPAAGSAIGLGRPANTPAASTSVLGQARDPIMGASVTNVDTAWSTAPTAPAAFIRRMRLPAAIGAGVIWTWSPEDPLVLAISSWMVIWNYGAAAGAALPLYFVWDE